MAAALGAADKPNREVQELQRDVAQLQEQVKTLQQALEARITAATAQVQAATEATARVDAGVAGLQKAVGELDRKVVPLIAAQGSRVDQLAGTLSTLQQSLTDLTTAINHLQTQVADVGNAVKIIQSPAPKPPGAEELLRTAESDRLGGKPELALQEYAEFLKQYGDSPFADGAKYQVGMLHFAQKDMEAAAKDFDTLAQQYPKSPRVPEALLYKAKSLQALNRPAEARAACQKLRQKFPSHELAKQCVVPRQ